MNVSRTALLLLAPLLLFSTISASGFDLMAGFMKANDPNYLFGASFAYSRYKTAALDYQYRADIFTRKENNNQYNETSWGVLNMQFLPTLKYQLLNSPAIFNASAGGGLALAYRDQPKDADTANPDYTKSEMLQDFGISLSAHAALFISLGIQGGIIIDGSYNYNRFLNQLSDKPLKGYQLFAGIRINTSGGKPIYSGIGD